MDYKDYQRQWRIDNRDRIRAYNKRWRDANPSYFWERRKRIAEAEVDTLMNVSLPIITEADIISGAKRAEDGIYDGVCHACGRLIFAGAQPHKDIDPKAPRKLRGILCKRCKIVINHVKRSPELLRQMADYLSKPLSDDLLVKDKDDEVEPLYSPPTN